MRLHKKQSLIEQASDYIEAIRPQVEAAVADAREVVGPILTDAREKAAPYLAEALEKAGPALADARAKAAPIIASGAALAGEKAAAGRDLANAKVAQLKGEPEPKKASLLKKIALFAGVATVVGLVAKKLQAGGASDNWQSSYVPAPPPTPPKPAAPAAPVPDPAHAADAAEPADDAAGSSPDEAIADQSESPHPVTTPNDPAEVVAVEDTSQKQ